MWYIIVKPCDNYFILCISRGTLTLFYFLPTYIVWYIIWKPCDHYFIICTTRAPAGNTSLFVTDTEHVIHHLKPLWILFHITHLLSSRVHSLVAEWEKYWFRSDMIGSYTVLQAVGFRVVASYRTYGALWQWNLRTLQCTRSTVHWQRDPVRCSFDSRLFFKTHCCTCAARLRYGTVGSGYPFRGSFGSRFHITRLRKY